MKKLIIWDCDWADEFNIFGFDIIELDDYYKIIEYFKINPEYRSEYYFGTNEFIEFSNDELLYIFKNAVDLSIEDEKVITKHFGSSNGHSFLDHILDRMQNPEDYE